MDSALPPMPERCDNEIARVVLSECLRAVVPEGELADQWEGFSGPILSFTDDGCQIAFNDLQVARASFEAIEGDVDCGDLLIAAAKMAVSAFVVGYKNPYLALYGDRDVMFDDVHPLAAKALTLAHEAFNCDPFDPTIRINLDRPKKLQGAMEENWMRGIMENAVRPHNG